MSKFDQITAFIAVIEEHGFAAAARKHNVSTASISRQVSRLEASLKVQLIQRTTRQLSLTEVGAQYYQQAKKALDALQDAEMAIAGSQSEATGLLTVTSNRYFALHHLLPRLPEFMKLNPHLQINIELAERFPDLAQEGIDLIFGISMEGPLELVRKRVATTRYVLCASPDYLEEYGTPKVPTDLYQHRYITHAMRKPDNLLVFKDHKEIRIEPVLWLNDSQAMCDCAISGLGIVTLHDYIVTEALQKGLLIELPPEFQEPQQLIYLYYQKSRYLQPKIRKFIDFYTV
jgi:DNA-binding transcriptional LysR family regulator